MYGDALGLTTATTTRPHPTEPRKEHRMCGERWG